MPFYHIRRTIPNEHKLILSYSPGIAKISNFSIVSFIGIYGSKFKIARSREWLSHIYALSLWWMEKNKTKKTSVKHIRIRATSADA